MQQFMKHSIRLLFIILLCLLILPMAYATEGAADTADDSSSSEITETVTPSAPTIDTVQNTTNGIKLTWSAVAEAESYEIYRKISGEDGYTLIGTATSVRYTDSTARSGVTYVYRLKAVSGANISGYSDYVRIMRLATPSISSVKNNTDGLIVSWKAVDGATKYQVWRKLAGDDEYTLIKTTTDLTYTDTTVKNGKTYLYRIVALYKSTYSSTRSDYYAARKLAQVEISTAKNTSTGIKLTWSAVKGATGYNVYRKAAGEDSYTLVKSTTSTSYTDKTVSGNTKYYYKIQATYSSSQGTNSTGIRSDRVGIYRLSSPTLKSVKNTANGVTLTWNSVDGATKYRIYRKMSGEDTYTLIKTTTDTTYTDAKATAGKTCKYKVVAVRGSTVSVASDVLKIKCLTQAEITDATIQTNGVKITWGSVSGAKSYNVYRKAADEDSYTLIGTATSCKYTDKSVEDGVKYYYKVQAASGDYVGAKSAGKKITYVDDGLSAMDRLAQTYSSSTKYLLLVDTTENVVGIYTGKQGNWTLKYSWGCTTGKASTPTVTGVFTVGAKGKYFNGSTYTCWYYTQFYGNYLFHSVIYQKGSSTVITDGRIGQNLSHGCVRLTMEHALWIYNNIPTNTTVVVY